MQARRPLTASLALAASGVLLAWLLATPLLLAIPVGIGGLVLAHQYRFIRDIQTLQRDLVVTQTLATHHLRANQSTTLTIAVSAADTPPVDVSLRPRIPASVAPQDTSSVSLSDHDTTDSFTLESRIAGRYDIDAPELVLESRDGLFTETIRLGNAESLVVAPAGPREIHVGEGGERFAAAYGEHPAGTGGAGLDPSELRRYLPGDPTNRIDWKATARLNEPHVREFDAETDRETQLIVDTRTSMHDGPEAETKLDYARQLALAFVESAEHLDDPLGLVTFDDTGITTDLPPTASRTHYRQLRTRLHDLTPPTESTPAPAGTPDENTGRGPDTAHQDTTRLAGDDSAFATTLRPFLENRSAYVQRLGDQPRFSTIQAQRRRRTSRTWTILVTDDTDRGELREAVKLARRGGGHVLVCLLPSILYEPGGLANLDDAYATYREFEDFRRQLATLDGVRAIEVGPRDRLVAILGEHRATTQGGAAP